jgi:glycosyltransferase involved in cell wall biosynthesis
LANYWPLKGYDVLFAAIMRLRQQGLNVELHIAGKDTDSAECRSQIAEGMKSYGLLDKEGVRRLLYNCDVLVLATRGETQGLVILEALSTGIPAISTEAIPPSVRPSEGCVFVPVDDAEALADAMKRAMSGPQPEGLLLSEHVRQFASPEVVGRQLSELFRSIVPSSSSI